MRGWFILAALSLLFIVTSAVAQSDPCDVNPDLPTCPSEPEPTPAPVVETPSGKFAIPIWLGWWLGGLFATLSILKFFGLLDMAMEAWHTRALDKLRYGHLHKIHHPKKGKIRKRELESEDD